MHTHDILPEICSISTVRSGHFTIELSGLHPVVTAGCWRVVAPTASDPLHGEPGVAAAFLQGRRDSHDD
jgi:hypothetical protein